MADERDDEIAELKARLERLERPSPVTPVRETKSGFSGGFFGCFGVLAAVVLVLALFLSLGQCAPPEPSQPGPVSIRETSESSQGGLGCATGLRQAEKLGGVQSSSSVRVPWVLEDLGTVNGVRTVRCEALDGDRTVFVVVDILCRDTGEDRCAKFKRIERHSDRRP